MGVAPPRLELGRPCGPRVLSPLRLPFRQGAKSTFPQAETLSETVSEELHRVAALALGYLEAGRVDLAKDVLRRYLAEAGDAEDAPPSR
jgi:hypothetical protein